MGYYFVANIRITDEQGYQGYLDRVSEISARYKGNYLVVENNPRVLEGSWDYTRHVIIEFPSKEDFEAWYYSAEYQEILKFRLGSADCDTILVKGKD